MKRTAPLPLSRERPAFTVSEALEAGATRGRLRASDLEAPFWGVRMPAGPGDEFLRRCAAFRTRMPPGAVYSHATAARLLGAPLPARLEGSRLHVGTPHTRRPLAVTGIIGHRMRLPAEHRATAHGHPITCAERTWFDLASLLSLSELVAAGDHFVSRRRPVTHVDALTAAFAGYPGRRGRRLIARALPLLDGGAESPRESWLRILLLEHGFPPFETNKEIHDADGRFLGRVDLVNRRHRLILEYEGDHHRSDPGQWRRDVGRIRALEAAGWRVIRVTAADFADPGRLLEAVRRHLARAARGGGPAN